jgi:hypothetical protein
LCSAHSLLTLRSCVLQATTVLPPRAHPLTAQVRVSLIAAGCCCSLTSALCVLGRSGQVRFHNHAVRQHLLGQLHRWLVRASWLFMLKGSFHFGSASAAGARPASAPPRARASALLATSAVSGRARFVLTGADWLLTFNAVCLAQTLVPRAPLRTLVASVSASARRFFAYLSVSPCRQVLPSWQLRSNELPWCALHPSSLVE